MDFTGEGAQREPFFRLIQAYCIELDGDTAAARSLYSSVIAKAPRTKQAFEAALRLRDLERLDSKPPFVFEGAALAAMRHWIYEPSDRPEPSRATVRLDFDIQYKSP